MSRIIDRYVRYLRLQGFQLKRLENPILLDVIKPVQNIIVNPAFNAINVSPSMLIQLISAIKYKQ